MNHTVLSFALITTLSIVSCSQSNDSCSDLEGTITHTTTESTGIESALIIKRSANSNVIEAVDQFNGTEFSNLIIEIELSWIDEQHRFRENNTFFQPFLDWFTSPVMACTLAPYYEDYQPAVFSLQIFSNSDVNENYPSGSDLSVLFAASGMMGESNSLLEATNNGSLASSKAYSLEPAWIDGELATAPMTPNEHIFTIIISLEDGSTFEIKTPELLLSGI